MTSTEELTGFPAILGHRVVTLHPKVHGGLLADPDDPEHRADMGEHGIEPIDLVVANLYPFGSAVEDFEHGGESPADLIDIGGPAMVRAAAKNHRRVGVVIDPADYEDVLAEAAGRRCAVRRHPVGGWRSRPSPPRRPTTPPSSTGCGSRAGTATAPTGRPAARTGSPPSSRSRCGKHDLDLRYGENPHQAAAL